jgi:hypothetical protein
MLNGRRIDAMLNQNIKDAWPDQANQIISLISGDLDPETFNQVQSWTRQCYNLPRDDELIMCAINELIEGHGVEAIRYDDMYIDSYHQDIVATYVNMGDTYNTTILLDSATGDYQVTCWGDYVEESQL